jgi:hypothetical protein
MSIIETLARAMPADPKKTIFAGPQMEAVPKGRRREM